MLRYSVAFINILCGKTQKFKLSKLFFFVTKAYDVNTILMNEISEFTLPYDNFLVSTDKLLCIYMLSDNVCNHYCALGVNRVVQ